MAKSKSFGWSAGLRFALNATFFECQTVLFDVACHSTMNLIQIHLCGIETRVHSLADVIGKKFIAQKYCSTISSSLRYFWVFNYYLEIINHDRLPELKLFPTHVLGKPYIVLSRTLSSIPMLSISNPFSN